MSSRHQLRRLASRFFSLRAEIRRRRAALTYELMWTSCARLVSSESGHQPPSTVRVDCSSPVWTGTNLTSWAQRDKRDEPARTQRPEDWRESWDVRPGASPWSLTRAVCVRIMLGSTDGSGLIRSMASLVAAGVCASLARMYWSEHDRKDPHFISGQDTL